MAPSGRPVRIVGGAQLLRAGASEVGADLPLGEGMVPAGEEIQSCLEQLLGAVRRHAGAAGRVLRIPHTEVERMLASQAGNDGLHRVAPGLSHDVADEQDPHSTVIQRWSVHTAPTRWSCSPTGTSDTSCESNTSATLGPWYSASVAS